MPHSDPYPPPQCSRGGADNGRGAATPADPYAPPSSSLGGMTPAEQAARDSGELRYADVWQRVAAQLIDTLFLVPVIVLDVFIGANSHMHALLVSIAVIMLDVYVYIGMTVQFGGSPGKLLLGLRIVNLDGTAARLKAALRRYSVMGTMTMASSVVMMLAVFSMPEELYRSLPFWERGSGAQYEQEIDYLSYLMIAWAFAGFLALLLNAQRRALHDFMAGTVVVQQ
jgi:uncharacterized RDD family membrane protein YckC